MINLAHPGIHAAHHARGLSGLSQRKQRGDAHHRQPGAECQPLGHATRDTQAGERAWPLPESDAVETLHVEPMAIEQIIDHRQQALRVALPDVLVTSVHVAVAPQRNGTVLGGGIQRQDLQAPDFSPGRAPAYNPPAWSR